MDFDTMPFIKFKYCAFTYGLTDKMCQSVSCQRMCHRVVDTVIVMR